MPTEVFQRWGLDFMGPIDPPTKHVKNHYIITATNYTTKWVKAITMKDNIAKSTAKFFYEDIITKFGKGSNLGQIVIYTNLNSYTTTEKLVRSEN